MKKYKIFTGLLLAASLLVLAACSNGVAPLAAPEPEDDIVLTDDYNMGFLDVADDSDFDFELPLDVPVFGFVTGEVVNIDTNDFGERSIQIEGEQGTAFLTTYFNTFILGGTPEVGETITGYFALDMPMAMIYPPQHVVSVIVNNDSFQDDGLPFVHVCRFFERSESTFGAGDQLISADGELIINLGGDTEITLQNGDAFDGEIAGRMLVVTYAMNTFSIPPQTTPIQIIVLYERAVTGPEFVELPDDWADGLEDWEPHYDIVIDGEGLVGALVIFIGEDAVFPTHLELVPVAEALGAEVYWNQSSNTVTLEGLNGNITFTPGSYDFTVNGEIVTLAQPSVDFYGTVYVPILFFRDVFGMASAYSFEGRMYISSTESDMY
ncbi:MAG: copper amine oxidase N-terminal domain-containing protein [Defluviitaleaceae bacterium]|nr:copper amine oxidase N-terminal domain-containing protein [Defluviitaleaceae bacterium]